jgi:hypothetical protein
LHTCPEKYDYIDDTNRLNIYNCKIFGLIDIDLFDSRMTSISSFKEEEDGKIKVNIIAVDETRETVYFLKN